MKKVGWWSIAGCMLAALVSMNAPGEDIASARALFENPTRDYTTAPFWVWNDMLTDQMMKDTLADLASQDIHQVFVHPRPGLMTPYLSEDWFHLWDLTFQEAAKYDMNVWIYDENSYPSGFAGGFVPDIMPESRGQGLIFNETKTPGTLGNAVLAIYRKSGEAYEDITEKVRAGESFPEGAYLVAAVQQTNPSPWFGNKFYVDLLKPGVTEKFLEITLEPYRQRYGAEFGKRMPGSFTDEPHLRPAGGFHWTGDLPQWFEKRWGYSLLKNLPSLKEPVGDWKRVRHDYYQSLLELFIERWAKPYFEYCVKHTIEFTGHYWEHEWPNTGSAPDNMAMGAWQQRPGIDILFNQYDEGPHAQFGNVRAVLELASIANQMGWKRTLCEVYGGSGWDMRFEDFKRIGDWINVLGVNTMNEHLSHISQRGARKGDYPPSFSYHTPWWPKYHVLEKYFTRTMAAMTRGEQINQILMIEPTSTAWMLQGTGEPLETLGNTFQQLVTTLAQAQVEFDLGAEDTIATHGSVKDATFIVAKRAYHTVVIPALTENLNIKTVELLESYLANGGRVLCCGDVPARVDGQISDRVATLAKQKGWKQIESAQLTAELAACNKEGFAVHRAEGDKGILYHQRRQLADGDLLFLVNTSIEAPTAGIVESSAKSVQEWNLETGAIMPYAFAQNAKGVSVNFSLPPCGSLLLMLSDAPGEPAPANNNASTSILASGTPEIRRAAVNVLTLDYVDVAVDDTRKENMLFHRASELVFKKNGINRNPWDHAIQFKDEYISKTFPKKSGFEVTYRFTIEGEVPKPLYFVMERSDLYTVRCNGKKIEAPEGAWWYDRCCGKMDISALVKPGENRITAKAEPFTIRHEIQPAYVIGDFSLKSADKGFVITAPQPLALGPWNTQGAPLYGDAVSYTMKFNMPALAKHYRVSLPKWYGSVASVKVNGQEAGHIYRQPWECDVTKSITSGENTVEVLVYGTLKNTLGPHHENPPLGIASPDMFRKGPETGPPPGADYSTIGYGLFEPFALLAGE